MNDGVLFVSCNQKRQYTPIVKASQMTHPSKVYINRIAKTFLHVKQFSQFLRILQYIFKFNLH